jgi:hypothetical protein
VELVLLKCNILRLWNNHKKRLALEERRFRIKLASDVERYHLKLDQERELKGEFDPFRRLIIITGMARSGTSVMAALIGSHPKVKPVIGGECWDVVETDLFRPELGPPDWVKVDELLRDNYPYRIMLKQPWLMTDETLSRALKPAKLIVLIRDKSEILNSWHKSRRVGQDCRITNTSGSIYDQHAQHLDRLKKEGALIVNKNQINEDLVLELGRFLRLDPRGFNLDIIKTRWKESGEKEWFSRYPIRKERRK